MSKLQDFALYITSAHTASFTALDGMQRLEAVKDFYNKKGLTLPPCITVTSTKKVAYLSKDERNAITNAVALAAINGEEITVEMKQNVLAVNNPDATITTTKTESYKNAVETFGASVVAAKLIDGMNATNNEEFHKIRKFDVSASVDISTIPAFIKELQKIYNESHKTETETEKPTK